MNLRTFRIGGVHPEENKITAEMATQVAPLPKQAIFPLGQHIGAPAKPVVAKGDKVKVGTLIAEAGGFVSAPIYSSVSGTVFKVDTSIDATGYRKPCIIINVEGDEWEESIDRSDKLETLEAHAELTPEEIVNRIKVAGVTGMGGAGFPTFIKLCPPPGAKAECVIINGVECEPYITADYRSVMDDAQDLVTGAKIMKKMAEAKTVYICIKESHPDLIEKVKSALQDAAGVEVYPVPDVYPMGWERVLVREVLHKEYGGLPAEAGAIIGNASSAIAIAKAFEKGEAITQKNLTVSGECVKDPHNVCVPVGMPVSEIIEACGGYTQDTVRLISGGPMMGKTIVNDMFVVDRAMNALTVLPAANDDAIACLRCGKCSDHCPSGLQPVRITAALKANDVDEMSKRGVMSCIECGMCTYICPSHIDVTENVRKAKRIVMLKKK